MLITLRAVLVCFLFNLAFINVSTAQDAPKLSPEQIMASVHFKTGKITLPGGLAELNLPDNFRYLSPIDAETILTKGWGNPPDKELSLGMIVPANLSPLSAEGWGVVITYQKDGHVKDDDAQKINYNDLLKDMQEGEKEDNDMRQKQGYPTLNLVGWAEPPSYDNQTHKLYWAKNIKFGTDPENTLNYNVRVLGREGVLVLNAVASMHQLADIKQQMQTVNNFSNFTAGNGYNDFNSSTDKVAEYGIAALIAGGVAAKVGLFGKLLALLLAFKKIVLVAVAAVGGFIVNLFKGKKKAEAPIVPPSSTDNPPSE